MKKIIVLGATGNTGCYLVDYMSKYLKGQYEIIAVGHRKTSFFDRYGIKYYSVDISQKETLSILPTEDIHAVVFEAGLLPASMEGYHPEKYLFVNTIGAYNVLEFCRANHVDRILYTQTIREIGNYINQDALLSPDMPRSYSYKGDHAVYVISKIAAEDLIEHYFAEYGLKRYIFRLPTIYSYQENDIFYVDGLPRKIAYRLFIEKAIHGEPIEMWGDPTKAHDVVYVKDFCQMLTKAVITRRGGGVYHVGTGQPISLKEQIEGIIEVFSGSKKSDIILCPEKPNARSYTMDISKAKEDLGYEPQYSYLEYLKDYKIEMELKRFAEL